MRLSLYAADAALLASLALPGVANAQIASPAAALAINHSPSLVDNVYYYRPGWRCGPWGCGWRRGYGWRPYYYRPYAYYHRPFFYRPYAFARPYWGWRPWAYRWGYRSYW